MKSIQEKKAIEMLVAGETQEETAATVGVSTATMSRFANREDIRKIVEDCHLELAREGVQLIVEGNLRFLRAVNKLTKDKTPEEIARIVGDNKPLFDLMDKKEKRIGQSVGMFTSDDAGIKRIYQQTNIGALTPAAMEYMAYLKGRDNEDAIDILPEK